MNPVSYPHGRALAALLLPLCVPYCAAASVLSKPQLHSTFDPVGAREITVVALSASTPREIQSLADLGVLRDFPGFVAGESIVSLADPQRSDARLRFSGRGDAGSGAEITNSAFLTSSGSGVKIASNNMSAAHVITGEIDFGFWDHKGFRAGIIPVTAVGFTLSAPAGRLERLASIQVEFISPEGRVLSAQKVPGPVAARVGFFFGHHANEQEPIAHVRIVVSVAATQENAKPQAVLLGLDDLGWTSTAPLRP
jgi:hypothetical protein